MQPAAAPEEAPLVAKLRERSGYWMGTDPQDAKLMWQAADRLNAALNALQMICDSGAPLADPIERAMLDALKDSA